MQLPGMFSWSIGDLGSAMGKSLTNFIAGGEPDKGVDPNKVQTQYNNQRNTVRKNASESGFQGDYRNPAVTTTDNFLGYKTTQALRERVDKITITSVADLEKAWTGIATKAESSLTAFNAAMAKATDQSVWRGASRDAVAQAVTDYSTKAVQLANSAKLTSSKVAELKTGLEPTYALVPHAPDHRSGWDNTRSWIAGRGWRSNSEAEDTAFTEAVRVLDTVYAPVIKESDTGVPVIPKPDSQVSKNPTEPVTPKPNTGVNPKTSEPVTAKPETEDPTVPANTGAPTTDPNATTPASTTPASTTGTPTSTTPASTNPTTPTTGTPSGTPGAGTPRSGTPRSGTPGTGTPRSGTPAAPRTIAGTPNSAAAVANSAASRAASAGARNGMPGMGGMNPRNGKGEDDESTKGIPDYLITQEHGDEVTGLDSIPKVVPPVIGA
ncbi:hypothetical protein ACFVMC_27640 [Nocardia sp. NPDC127579]|uniref:hypothetical protein n=1 Tax=Nocardia sp. NPDC127579 TaxID=3345402 RepID=UPI003634A905